MCIDVLLGYAEAQQGLYIAVWDREGSKLFHNNCPYGGARIQRGSKHALEGFSRVWSVMWHLAASGPHPGGPA